MVLMFDRQMSAKYLKDMDFDTNRNITGRSFMVGHGEVIAQCHSCLCKIKKRREQGCHIVYSDANWINTHQTLKGGWVEENQASTSILEPFGNQLDVLSPMGRALD